MPHALHGDDNAHEHHANCGDSAGFAQWKEIMQLALGCERAALHSQTHFFVDLLRVLQAQLEQGLGGSAKVNKLHFPFLPWRPGLQECSQGAAGAAGVGAGQRQGTCAIQRAWPFPETILFDSCVVDLMLPPFLPDCLLSSMHAWTARRADVQVLEAFSYRRAAL